MPVAHQTHILPLPHYPKPSSSPTNQPAPDPQKITQQWLTRFAAVLSSASTSALPSVLESESWWRDHLALSWDLRTLHGLSTITAFLDPRLAGVRFSGLRLVESGQFVPKAKVAAEGLEWIEAMFLFETEVGRGKGMVRLVESGKGAWKAAMVYTCLRELKGFEERVGARRPHGGTNAMVDGDWGKRREREREFLDADPVVLVVGAGQSGLTMAARLQALGMSCLIIDKNERIGDNWRHRYRTLVTHDPVHYTHMAYLPFPTHWPMFSPKDKLADWLEYYAGILELNVWMRCTITLAEYWEKNKQWAVQVHRPDGFRQVKVKHIVFCAGHAGEPLVPSFPGQNTFKGVVYHSSQHKDASKSENIQGKKVVVVGTGNSGHDIAQNYYEQGAEVLMVQRHGTYVLSAKTGLFMLHKDLYEEDGPPTEDADIYAQSLPIHVQFALNVGLTDRIKAAEKDTLDGLARAGFEVSYGDDRSGIYRKYITRGGGYYIDVGASQLIVDGKIKVVQSLDGIRGFERDGLVLADGRKLEADIVVLATGFDNMKTTIRKILGKKVADRCKDVWDLDEEGEVNAMWRPSGHPRLWCMGGSLALCRNYSKTLALQIMAVEAGLNKQ